MGKTRQEWVNHFAAVDICFTPVLDLAEMSQHPQVRDREMVIMIKNIEGSGQHMAITGWPIKLSLTPAEVEAVFPERGAHTDEILQEAGYALTEIEQLKKKMVIA